jgi:methionyl aminopeptidase
MAHQRRIWYFGNWSNLLERLSVLSPSAFAEGDYIFMITLKTPAEIETMAEGGRILARVLKALKAEAKAGVTTKALDQLARELIVQAGATPAFLHYRPHGAREAYPWTLCASLNDVVVHGQPSDYALRAGDVLSLDLGLKYKGFYSDAALTVGVGKISKEARKLISATETALAAGIKTAKPGKTLGDIGHAIETVARKNGCMPAEGLVGHGIGRALHEDPSVFNFGVKGQGDWLEEGMVIAIEPMLCAGSGATKTLPDESYATRDGSLSAHFEHTVAITKRGPKILTR